MYQQQVHVLELWNNNIKQLENNMLISDTLFWNNWNDFFENKNCSDVEISECHTAMGKHTIIGKFTMKKSLTSYNFLKIKCQM